MKNAKYWVEQLQLQEHPEGGYYKEMYRSPVQMAAHGTQRNVATSIYFLLTSDQTNTLHRIKSDELWHFYEGDELIVHVIEPGGAHHSLKMGDDPVAGQTFLSMVRAGSWFAAEVPGDGKYALVGCTVAPGFDFDDLEMGSREKLLEEFPQHGELIERLTVPH